MPRKKNVALATATDSRVHLSQVTALRGVEVARDEGRLGNLAILSRGPLIGHGFDADDTMLRQVREGLKAKQVRVHLTHSHAQGGFFSTAPDGLNTLVGHVIPDSTRIEQGVVRADIQLSKASANVPGLGNVRQFLLDMAEEAPGSFGLSIVFEPAEFESRTDDQDQSLPPAGRIKRLVAVDFVEDPASNVRGLLSRADAQNEGEEMNKELLALLHSLGLQKDATDAQALEFVKTLKRPEDIEAAKTLASVELAKQIGERSKEQPAPVVPVETLEEEKDLAQELAKQQNRITNLGKLAKLDEQELEAFVAKHMQANTALEAVAADAMNIRYEKFKNPDIKTHATVVTGGENLNLATLGVAIEDALLLRARAGTSKIVKTDDRGNICLSAEGKAEYREPHARASEFRGLPIVGMIRNYLGAMGVRDVMKLENARLAALIGPREFRKSYPEAYALAQSTSDFGNILENVMRKSLRQAYVEAPRTWSSWARRATTPDFRPISRASLSDYPGLLPIDEGGGIHYVTLADGKETYSLVEYNNGIKLTRRAIINDDLDAFGRIPQLQANSAAQKEDDVAYAVLTGNPVMADGENLFSSAHANVVASNGGPPTTVAEVDKTRALIRRQRGPAGSTRLELRPRFILVPDNLEITTEQFMTSAVDPAKNNQTANPFANTMTVIGSSRLGDASTKVWYMVADFRDGIDTVEVCFLEGEPAPVLKQETEFDTEDVKFAVRHTVAAAAIDHRGMARNKGEA